MPLVFLLPPFRLAPGCVLCLYCSKLFQTQTKRHTMRTLFVRAFVFLLLVSLAFAATPAQAPKPKRINRAIELLSQGQPIYYTGSHSGTEGSFEQGKKDAQIWSDYISYD